MQYLLRIGPGGTGLQADGSLRMGGCGGGPDTSDTRSVAPHLVPLAALHSGGHQLLPIGRHLPLQQARKRLA